jgi:hypothetical protein
VTSYLVVIVYLSLVKEKNKILLLFESRLPHSINDVFFKFLKKKILPSVAILDSNVIVDHTTSHLQHVITLVNPNLHLIFAPSNCSIFLKMQYSNNEWFKDILKVTQYD